MANTTKITKKMRFEQLLNMAEVQANPDFVAFIQHEIELLDSKKSGGAETKLQKENADIKDSIYEAMADNTLYTITDMIKSFDFLTDMTNQKISALVNQMVRSNLVERIEDKKKTYFKKI